MRGSLGAQQSACGSCHSLTPQGPGGRKVPGVGMGQDFISAEKAPIAPTLQLKAPYRSGVSGPGSSPSCQASASLLNVLGAGRTAVP